MTGAALPGPGYRAGVLAFSESAEDFLAVAGDHLAADPVLNTVIASVALRMAGPGQPDWCWWLVACSPSGEVAGVGMRTAPFEGRPPFLLPLPPGAAAELARTLHRRGEAVTTVNGALPTVEEFAAETARLRGGRVQIKDRTILYELGTLQRPRPAPGALRAATEDDIDLVTAWFAIFGEDADEQSGVPRGSGSYDIPGRAEVLRRIRAGLVWLWTDPTGRPVHLTYHLPPAFGTARIAHVYTPPAERGRGWAANAVAAISQRLLAGGSRVCLYADEANPTSNRLYTALGYRRLTTMATLTIAA
jgi:RimJ/RimL family protein N-acetyltransferase